MTFKSTTQPLCRFCGKPIAKHTRRVWIETNPEIGKGPATEWSRHVHVEKGSEPKNRADCQQLTNHQVVSLSYTERYDDRLEKSVRSHVRSFSEWDGESYSDPYFCNGDHARRFAYAVVNGHPTMAMTAYREALAKRAETPTPAAG
jgi:hypothetical protein